MKVETLSCLAYSHFHLFLHLKKHLAGQKFHEDEKVRKVTSWFCAQVAELFDFGIQELVPRLNKCLDKGGDDVEK